MLCVINSSFILKLRSDGPDEYTDQLDGAFIVWFSIFFRLKIISSKKTAILLILNHPTRKPKDNQL